MSISSNPLNSTKYTNQSILANPVSQANLTNTNDFTPNESIFSYAFEIISDIFLGVVLGVSVNAITDVVARELNLPKYAKLLLQFTLIIIVLYILKIDSKYLYSSWKGQTSYGIVFTTVFFAVQKNMLDFFTAVYIEIKNNE